MSDSSSLFPEERFMKSSLFLYLCYSILFFFHSWCVFEIIHSLVKVASCLFLLQLGFFLAPNKSFKHAIHARESLWESPLYSRFILFLSLVFPSFCESKWVFLEDPLLSWVSPSFLFSLSFVYVHVFWSDLCRLGCNLVSPSQMQSISSQDRNWVL